MATTVSEPPKAGFRLSMLIYDTRYRSMTIQVVALIGFLILIGFLVSNTIQNLNELGKDVSFDFLEEPAGYDINQTLLDYNNQHSHLRAAVIGLLNTLLVAFLGCITATIIGVIVGVARLSNNWLVARLMTIYVEMFRNVPVLLWIVFAMAILIETLPSPRDFKSGEATMSLFGSTAFANQGIFIPRLMATPYAWLLLLVFLVCVAAVIYIRKRALKVQANTGRLPKTGLISLVTLVVPVCVVFLGLSALSRSNTQVMIAAGLDQPVTAAVAAEELGSFDLCYPSGSASSLAARQFLEAAEIKYRRQDYFSKDAARRNFIRGRCDVLVVDQSSASATLAALSEEMRDGTKLTVLADDFSEGNAVRVEYPRITETGIPRFEGGTVLRNSLLALWLALSLYTAAFIAEIVRAGILAISAGQTEAASALGLRPKRIMSLVVLPQALRVIIPPLISQYLNLTKNSSLAIAVGYMDLTGTLMGITLNQTGKELETLMIGMLIYLLISLSISAGMNWYNNRVKLVER
ncbi:ABC transporter permease subunit [Vannielia sp.]|uniref:amino acid ABC transporter permease n=1 Tax=Vannielia sp. TaxID=2813045 RepID=UPI00263626FA|nr:ABC transporter permease subunit [Vannielia sp.]MDF1871861.1 ABC transporter permease subunit [Vannielia sp.]